MFIPYLGEKSKFSNFIIPNIPTDISTYVEPFGGAYGIYFSLDLTQFHTSTQFIYNDINPLNSNLFTQLGNPDFISIMKETKATLGQHLRSKPTIFWPTCVYPR
jgi:site-specific DNA-adenine methylase